MISSVNKTFRDFSHFQIKKEKKNEVLGYSFASFSIISAFIVMPESCLTGELLLCVATCYCFRASALCYVKSIHVFIFIVNLQKQNRKF